MKIIFNIIKNLVLFMTTTFIAGFAVLASIITYECVTSPNHIFSNIESEENTFFIVNASKDFFDVEILFGEELLYKKEINPNSKDSFVYNISRDNNYQIKYKIGDKEEVIIIPASIYNMRYYYILLTSNNEIIFENLYVEKGIK